MGLRGRRVIVAMLVLVLAAACSGSGGSDGEVADVAEATDIATDTPTEPTAVEDPTSTPVPEVVEASDEDKIAAAIAVLESEPLPADLIAYDMIEARLRGATGVVDIEVCGWTGDTVFDDVYLLAYRLTAGDDGSVSATLESATTTPGDCTNTTLIETALQFTRDYDTFWRGVANDPAAFDPGEADQFWSEEVAASSALRVADLADNGLSYQNDYFDAGLPGSAVAEVLGRSYELDGVEIFEILGCRSIPSGFGLYRGEVLVDDFRPEEPAGSDVLLRYQLVRRDGAWKVGGFAEQAWIDCGGFGDEWLDGVNEALPDPTPWERILA